MPLGNEPGLTLKPGAKLRYLIDGGQLLGADRDIRALLRRVPKEEAADAVVCYLETEEEMKMAIL